MTMITEQGLKQIQQVLERELEQLLRGAMDQDSRTQGVENPDENDLADRYESQVIQSSLDELSIRKQGRIRSALERLSKGIYGVCLQCNRAIPDERLFALPDAELCIACQERLEGKDKLVPLYKGSRRKLL